MTDLLNIGANTQKKQLNKMKHELEPWRELLLLANSILKWEKKCYIGIIVGACSLFFLVLWYFEMSLLTQTSLLLLFFNLMDYIYPMVSKIVFKSDNWTGEQEKRFEEVCLELCAARNKVCAMYDWIFVPKQERSTFYILSVCSGLLGLAWIGSSIDNLLLSYLSVLFVCMYPGLLKHGVVCHVKEKVMGVMSKHFKTVKEKVSDINKKSD